MLKNENHLAKNIKYLRLKNNLTTNDFAKAMGARSYEYVHDWESGKYEPSLSRLRKMANYFGVSLDDLINTDIANSNHTPPDELDNHLNQIISKIQYAPKNMTIGECIRKYRQEHEMTTRDFAEKSGISHGHISVLEYDKNHKTNNISTPNVDTFKKIAKGMHLSPEQLAEKLGYPVPSDTKSQEPLSEPKDKKDFTSRITPITINFPEPKADTKATSITDMSSTIMDTVSPITDTTINDCTITLTNSDFHILKSNHLIVTIHKQTDVESKDIAVVSVSGKSPVLRRITRSAYGLYLTPLLEASAPEYYENKQIKDLPIVIYGRVKQITAVLD